MAARDKLLPVTTCISEHSFVMVRDYTYQKWWNLRGISVPCRMPARDKLIPEAILMIGVKHCSALPSGDTDLLLT